MKKYLHEQSNSRVEGLLNTCADLRNQVALLTRQLATVTKELQDAKSNAGWEREYYQQLARESDTGGWK